MRANVLRDALGNITVHIEGDLDYEYSLPFREQLTDLTAANPHSAITIDMAAVNFVGSSGIGHFVETITSINDRKKGHNKLKVANTSDQFIRVFKLYTLSEAQVFWDEEHEQEESVAEQMIHKAKIYDN